MTEKQQKLKVNYTKIIEFIIGYSKCPDDLY